MKLSSLPSGHMLAGRYYVSNVTPDGPIVKAGIAVNDVLMKIDDEDVLGKALDEVEEILKVSFPVHPLCPGFCPFFPILIASLASPSPSYPPASHRRAPRTLRSTYSSTATI
jgi:hypothetical protein